MKIKQITNHGNTRFKVDFGMRDGKRRVQFFETEGAAAQAIKDDAKDTDKVGRQWLKLPAQTRLALVKILEEMTAANVTLQQVWDAFRRDRLAVDVETSSKTLRAAINELVKAKRGANKRERYVKALERYLNGFAKGREETPVNRLDVAKVEAWFAARVKDKPSTKASGMNRLSTLFSFCKRKGYVAANPIDNMETVSVEARAPIILTVKQTRVLLKLCWRKRPLLLPYLTLGLFCGVRPEELAALDWSAVDMQRNRLTIGAAVSKVRRQRIVTIPENAIEWLKLHTNRTGPISPPLISLRRYRRYLRDRLKLTWQADILRHTAASYMLAFHEDPPYVSMQLGNSVSVLLTRYRELVHKEEAEKFFALTPHAPREIIQLSKVLRDAPQIGFPDAGRASLVVPAEVDCTARREN